MLSSACRRTVLLRPSLARTFTTPTTTSNSSSGSTSTSIASSNSVAASALASSSKKTKEHQLFLLNRCTVAATTTTTTASRSTKQPAKSAASSASNTPQQPSLSRQFHSYSTSSSSSSSSSHPRGGGGSSRRTLTTSSTQEQQATSTKTKRTFLEWYESHLEAHPVLTKMFTGSLLWGIGDAVAQIVPQVKAFSEDEGPVVESSVTEFTTGDGKTRRMCVTGHQQSWSDLLTITYDWPRTGRAALFGFALHAPTSHLHFNFLEWLTHRVGVTGSFGIPIFKAFMEQFVYWSWISNSMYHGAMGAMQGMSLQQIYDRIADVLWETQKAQWVFWIPVQLLNFRFVPVRHQLNVVLVTSIVWTALLSAWYPPAQDHGKKVEEEKEMDKEDAVAAAKITTDTKAEE